jgi:hypothetical protein
MLPAMWKSPPCMNIELKMVNVGDGRSRAEWQAPVSRQGTSPNSSMNAWPARAPGPSPTSSETW